MGKKEWLDMKNAIIQTADLCKSYAAGRTRQDVLKNINIVIYEGDFTVIMGRSGSGKSTLLYSLSSMDRPTGGKVELLGNDLAQFDDKQIAALRSKEISFIFQSVNLLPDLTAFENIAYPAYLALNKNEANKKADALLAQFGLAEERNRHPSEMSGGQQQRVAIARALACGPSVIFADEPTGALNLAAGIQVLDCLTRLYEANQSIVMVTHDVDACVRANRLLFMMDGQIDGDIELGRYCHSEHMARREVVLRFLEERNW
jgi:putative ABC transport system ATP-binding protein